MSKRKSETPSIVSSKKQKKPFTNITIRTAVNMYQDNKDKAIETYGKMHTWDTSRVTNMHYLFRKPGGQSTIFDGINDDVSNWDVSNVTNMSCAFFNCETFNQDLNGWKVSNVKNMWAMFLNCKTFDKPLDTWDVSKVTNTEAMFKNCETFDKPLDTWDVSKVTNMSEMFANCTRFNQDIRNWVINPRNWIIGTRAFNNCPNMIAENKPGPPGEWRHEAAVVEVNIVQVHQAAAKIDFTELNDFLITKISPPIPPNLDVYALHIKNALDLIIDNITETPEKKTELKAGIQKIYDDRLEGLDYRDQSEVLRDSIINSLEYVKIQPENFKQIYIKAFVEDCLHAHEGYDGMTCPAGALERIIVSLLPACKTAPENSDYIKLEELINPPTELIIQSIVDWYKSHNPNKPENVGAVAFPVETPIEEKRADLRRYLLRLYPDNTVLIDKLIDQAALEDDDFTYGGKRRNSRKRKNRRINKTRKRQKNKTKKTIHKRKNRT
jgi:surface protein